MLYSFSFILSCILYRTNINIFLLIHFIVPLEIMVLIKLTNNLNFTMSMQNSLFQSSGLLKQNNVEFLTIYRKEVDSAIKAIIKSCAIEIVSSSNFSFQSNHSSELTSLDDQIKYLNILEWLSLLKNCTQSLGKQIRVPSLFLKIAGYRNQDNPEFPTKDHHLRSATTVFYSAYYYQSADWIFSLPWLYKKNHDSTLGVR